MRQVPVSADTPIAAVLAVLAGLLLTLALASTAAAAPSCAEQVLLDWSDNGRVDRLYRLSCYEEALDALPPDIRDYTDAADVIERALQSAVRHGPVATETRPADSASSSRTVIVLALAGASVALAAAAGIAYLARRAGPGRSGTRR
jgi:hypothetical protein